MTVKKPKLVTIIQKDTKAKTFGWLYPNGSISLYGVKITPKEQKKYGWLVSE